MAFTLNYGGDDHSLIAAFVRSLPENGFGPLIAEITFKDQPIINGVAVNVAYVNGDWEVTGVEVDGRLILTQYDGELDKVGKNRVLVEASEIDTISFY